MAEDTNLRNAHLNWEVLRKTDKRRFSGQPGQVDCGLLNEWSPIADYAPGDYVYDFRKINKGAIELYEPKFYRCKEQVWGRHIQPSEDPDYWEYVDEYNPEDGLGREGEIVVSLTRGDVTLRPRWMEIPQIVESKEESLTPCYPVSISNLVINRPMTGMGNKEEVILKWNVDEGYGDINISALWYLSNEWKPVTSSLTTSTLEYRVMLIDVMSNNGNSSIDIESGFAIGNTEGTTAFKITAFNRCTDSPVVLESDSVLRKCSPVDVTYNKIDSSSEIEVNPSDVRWEDGDQIKIECRTNLYDEVYFFYKAWKFPEEPCGVIEYIHGNKKTQVNDGMAVLYISPTALEGIPAPYDKVEYRLSAAGYGCKWNSTEGNEYDEMPIYIEPKVESFNLAEESFPCDNNYNVLRTRLPKNINLNWSVSGTAKKIRLVCQYNHNTVQGILTKNQIIFDMTRAVIFSPTYKLGDIFFSDFLEPVKRVSFQFYDKNTWGGAASTDLISPIVNNVSNILHYSRYFLLSVKESQKWTLYVYDNLDSPLDYFINKSESIII